MKNNNKSRNFGRNRFVESTVTCSCGNRTKIKSRKNYPFGKKGKPLISKYYKCEKCGETKIINREQKGGRRK